MIGDEAATAGPLDLAWVANRARAAGCKTLFVGDDRQPGARVARSDEQRHRSHGSLRIMAMMFGVTWWLVSTVLIVRELLDTARFRWTALICGVLSPAPVLEAFIANAGC